MNVKFDGQIRSILDEAIGDAGLLVVGVSGGPDSLAMLHQILAYIDGARVHVAHLDHRMRPQSGQEALRVAAAARASRLAYHGSFLDVPQLAQRERMSLEEAGRKARYGFLAAVAREVGAKVVAVGHNADDQVETILLHFLRGSGLTGLRGMQPVSFLPDAPELTLIRPLLGQSRAEIEAYCAEHDLRPIVDESNLDPTFLRNRIRHQLLPALATYNPQIRRHLLQLGDITTAEESLVQEVTDGIWPSLVEESDPDFLRLNRWKWTELPLALQRRTIRRAVSALAPDARELSFQTVQQVLEIANRKVSGSELMLPGGLSLLVGYDTISFSRGDTERGASLPQLPTREAIRLVLPGGIELANGWVLTAEWASPTPQEITANDDPWLAYVDLHGRDAMYVRGRLPGERMQPLGMDGRSARLQDIMVNRKVASSLRESWPVLATDEHIIWLVGHLLDHRARITRATRGLVKLRCSPMEEKSC